MSQKHLSQIGEIVRLKRALHGHSLSDLANAVGCSPSLLSAIERGQKPPTVDIALQISAYFGMTRKESRELLLAALSEAPSFRMALGDELDRQISAFLAVLTNRATGAEKQEILSKLEVAMAA